MTTTLTAQVIPCGGIVKLYMATDQPGNWMLTRTPTSPDIATPYVLYSGPPLRLPNGAPGWVDDGDGTNLPLDQATQYTYVFVVGSDTATQAVTPAGAIAIEYDDYLRLFVRVLQAGIAAVQFPTAAPPAFSASFKPVVNIAMPLVGQPPIPCISINDDMTQQDDDNVPIGRGVNSDTTNNFYQVFELVRRRYSVTILASSVDERVFWQWVVLALFKTMLVPLLEQIGQNVTSGFQTASSQVATAEQPPGFYFCTIMLEFTGDFPVRVTTNYPVVEEFEVFANGSTMGIF